MTGLYIFLGIGAAILEVLMIVKYFAMASDLRKIRNLLDDYIALSSTTRSPQSQPYQNQTPSSIVAASQSSAPQSAPNPSTGGNSFDPVKWNRLKSLKLYEDVYINGIKCSYYGVFERKHSFYPFDGQDLTGKRYLVKDNVGNFYFALTDSQAVSMMD